MNHVSLSNMTSASLLAQSDASVIGGKGLKSTPEQQRIQNAANEFEAVMLSMLFKEMRKSLDPSQGLFGGDGSDTYGGMFDMLMGQSLADTRSLGIAEMVQTYGFHQHSAE